MREVFDKVFPELKKQREDKERLQRYLKCLCGLLVLCWTPRQQHHILVFFGLWAYLSLKICIVLPWKCFVLLKCVRFSVRFPNSDLGSMGSALVLLKSCGDSSHCSTGANASWAIGHPSPLRICCAVPCCTQLLSALVVHCYMDADWTVCVVW